MSSDETPAAGPEAAPILPTLVVSSGQASPHQPPPGASAAPVPRGAVFAERYEDLGRIARGGMGDVRRVWDHVLGRGLAMKILPWEIVDSAPDRDRFLAEVRITASLQHPGVVPIHEGGELPDGRLWFTMKEVRGRTLRAVIAELHGRGGELRDAPSLRRVLDAFLRACDAVAYAHSRGVIHCDLKPDNVMIGEFGEVFVMDWGVARVIAEAERPGSAPPGARDALASSLGRSTEVLGTPAYMPPEQARGDAALIGPPTDVYALGAVLHEILSGEPPHAPLVGAALWSRVIAGSSLPPPPNVPHELATLAKRATARDPRERFSNARGLADGLRSWLDGARRRARALELVAEAEGHRPTISALRTRAAALGEEAANVLGRLQSYDPVDKKAAGWRLLDERERLEREAALAEVAWMQALQAALAEEPELSEAHDALAEHHRAELVAAEAMRDGRRAARHEALLRAHDRGRHREFLSGDGAVSLSTAPEGASVSLQRYVERDRRLEPEHVCELGTTPLRGVAVRRGSYLLTIRAPGFAETAYPVSLGRGEHWDGVRPGDGEPTAIALPRAGDLGPDECYVPAGFFVVGGDPDAGESLPRRRLWADAFVVQRHPVRVSEYLAFLNALVAAGHGDEALAACPRRPLTQTAEEGGVLAFARTHSGRFMPPDDAACESLDCPVTFVDWHGAERYARWLADKTGKPWRLLNELEWEKAARGVDGRFMPWGDWLEPTWAAMLGSHAGVPDAVPVTAHPTDASPYGVRGMAGNVRDWCGDVWRAEGPPTAGGIAWIVPAPRDDRGLRTARGGHAASHMCRLAARFAGRPGERNRALGFRLARAYP